MASEREQLEARIALLETKLELRKKRSRPQQGFFASLFGGERAESADSRVQEVAVELAALRTELKQLPVGETAAPPSAKSTPADLGDPRPQLNGAQPLLRMALLAYEEALAITRDVPVQAPDSQLPTMRRHISAADGHLMAALDLLRGVMPSAILADVGPIGVAGAPLDSHLQFPLLQQMLEHQQGVVGGLLARVTEGMQAADQAPPDFGEAMILLGGAVEILGLALESYAQAQLSGQKPRPGKHDLRGTVMERSASAGDHHVTRALPMVVRARTILGAEPLSLGPIGWTEPPTPFVQAELDQCVAVLREQRGRVQQVIAELNQDRQQLDLLFDG